MTNMKHIETNLIDLILINNKDKNNVNKELYRVLKPGGYLFGVDKPHKSHNSVCDIEDIGFIVKDSISYFFAKNNKVELDTICLAIKPLSEKNFAENIMKWGTGGLNIDGSRIPAKDIEDLKKNWTNRQAPAGFHGGKTGIYGRGKTDTLNQYTPEGRYPANFIIDKNIAHILDKQSGYSKSVRNKMSAGFTNSNVYGNGDANFNSVRGHNDEGGASRYFYNTTSYKDLLRYITVLGLPPIQSTVLIVGFDDANTIIEEINKNSNVKYEAIIMEEVK